MSKLNALKIKSITKIGMHSDGDGLYLKVQPSSKSGVINKSWIFRWGAQGKNTMGLGSEKDIFTIFGVITKSRKKDIRYNLLQIIFGMRCGQD